VGPAESVEAEAKWEQLSPGGPNWSNTYNSGGPAQPTGFGTGAYSLNSFVGSFFLLSCAIFFAFCLSSQRTVRNSSRMEVRFLPDGRDPSLLCRLRDVARTGEWAHT
jgi:hypothetical protein